MYLISDFSYVLLFPKDVEYCGGLTKLYDSDPEKTGSSFEDLFYFNEELILAIKKLLAEKALTEAVIFTAGRTADIPLVQKKLEGAFSGFFTPSSVGYFKTEPKAYEVLAQKLHCATSEVLFIDDSEKNIAAAQKAGCNAFQFKQTQETIQFLHQTLRRE